MIVKIHCSAVVLADVDTFKKGEGAALHSIQ